MLPAMFVQSSSFPQYLNLTKRSSCAILRHIALGWVLVHVGDRVLIITRVPLIYKVHMHPWSKRPSKPPSPHKKFLSLTFPTF